MSLNMKAVIKGTVAELLLSGILILILSLLAYFTKIDEQIINIGAYAAVLAGVLVGSVIITRAAERKKLAHVILACVLYIVVVLGVTMLLNGKISFNTHTAAVSGGIIAAALLGCVLGNKQ